MAPHYVLRPATEHDREWVRQLRYTVYREVIERQFGWDQAWQDDNFDRTFDLAELQIVQRLWQLQRDRAEVEDGVERQVAAQRLDVLTQGRDVEIVLMFQA